MPALHPVFPSPDVPVRLFHVDGTFRVFTSLVALANWLGETRLTHLGQHFHTTPDPAGLPVPAPNAPRWIARQGATLITADLLRPWLLPRANKGEQAWIRRWKQHPTAHRQGPVPGTGRHGGTYNDLLRSPHTAQLRREARFASFDEEGHPIPPVRACLRHRPTHWDDRRRSDRSLRNWKHRRRHQWKG